MQVGAQPLDHLYQLGEGETFRLRGVEAIAAGQTLELGGLEGPGVVRHIWFTCHSPFPRIYGALVLRAWWDGEEHPSIEVPLGDFFGVGFGREVDFASALVEMIPAGEVQHAALNSYLPMPFHEKARFAVENRSHSPVNLFFWKINGERVDGLGPDTGLLHASWRRENPVTRGTPFTILEATGRGRYLGTVMSYRILEPGSWVEGGEDIFIDGSETPTLAGIGSEDYFGQSWGFRVAHNRPFHGTSFGPQGDLMTAYRFHVPDPITFNESIRVTMRAHGANVGDRADDYAAVAYWYQTEPHAPFPPLPELDYDHLGAEERFRSPWWEVPVAFPEGVLPRGREIGREVTRIDTSGTAGADYVGRLAFDRDRRSKWCDTGNPDAQWIIFGFDEPRPISGIVLLGASTAAEDPGLNTRGFTLDARPSPAAPWQTVATSDPDHPAIDTPPDHDWWVIRFDPPLFAAAFRLQITDAAYWDPHARVPGILVYTPEE